MGQILGGQSCNRETVDRQDVDAINAFACRFPSFALRTSAVQQAAELSALRVACTDSERLFLIASITD